MRPFKEAIFYQMVASGADIGKIVTTARSQTDAVRVLALQERAAEADFPLCSFCMGSAGKITRFATLYLGGYMTYGAVDYKAATAPGQYSIEHLNHLLELFEK